LGSEREGEERVEVRIFAEKRGGTRKCGKIFSWRGTKESTNKRRKIRIRSICAVPKRERIQ
jgi:hypothetical protein